MELFSRMAGELGPAARIEGGSSGLWPLLRDSLDAGRSRSKVLKNFAALLGADGLTKVLTLVALAYLARTITHETFGQMAFAESLLLTALLASDFGLEWHGVREIARAPDAIRERVALISSLRCALFLWGGVALALVPLFFDKSTDIRIVTWLFGLSLLPNAMLLEWVFCGLERMEIVAVTRVIRAGVYSILILTLVRDDGAALTIPIAYFIATSTGTAVLLAAYVWSFGWPALRWQPRAWRYVLERSLPFAFNVLLFRGFYSVSMLVLGLGLSDRAVAFFSAAYRPVLVLIPLGGYLMTAVFPPLARAGTSSPGELRRHSRTLVAIVTICAAPILVEASVYAEEVMRTLFGSQYSAAGPAFRILALSVLLVWVSMVYATLLMAMDRTVRFMLGVILGLSAGSIVSIALVPVYGIEGAAWAVVLGQLMCLTFFWVSLPATLRSIPWTAVAAVSVASIVMVAVMLPLQSLSLVLSAGSGLVAYSVVLVFCLAMRVGNQRPWGTRFRTAPDC